MALKPEEEQLPCTPPQRNCKGGGGGGASQSHQQHRVLEVVADLKSTATAAADAPVAAPAAPTTPGPRGRDAPPGDLPSAGSGPSPPIGASQPRATCTSSPSHRQPHHDPHNHHQKRPPPRFAPATPRAAATSPSSSLLASVSPQQEPGSAKYLAKLLRLSQCAPHSFPKGNMADFLASFDLGADTSRPSNDAACISVEELQGRLREALNAKTTPTRAEHVNISLDLSASAELTLSLSASENNVLEGLNHIDPSLGGMRSTGVDAEQTGATSFRVVEVRETLVDQPQQDPVLQASVASHIVSALGAVDGSHWGAGEPSRDSQGWKFIYLCMDSQQQWTRQSKSQPKLAIAEYTHKEPEPILMSRPAYDCRGSLAILFPRGNRSLTIKYNHTSLHRTVGELVELFKPPPRQVPPQAPYTKTPKKPAPARKKKRESTAAVELDEDGKPKKKRRKKKDSTAQPGPDGPIMPPEYPGAAPAGSLSQGPSCSLGQQPTDENAQFASAFDQYPETLMGDGSASAQTQAAQAAQNASNAGFPVNVSREEAARRKEFARTMLVNAGVDLESLSTDQFNIFANQSPELQKESLNMLVKYGAERLRIVHPSNRESSASAATSTATTPAQATQATPSGPMTTKELVPQSQGSGRKGKKVGAANEGPEDSATPSRRRSRGGKSRIACYQCKSRRVKCPKDKPICTECHETGIACEYPPLNPRKKSSAMVAAEDDEDDEATPEAEREPEPEHLEEDVEEPVDSTDFSQYPQIPVANMLTPNVEYPEPPRQPDYFQSASNMALPQSDLMTDVQPSHLTGSCPAYYSAQMGSNSNMAAPQNTKARSAADVFSEAEPAKNERPRRPEPSKHDG